MLSAASATPVAYAQPLFDKARAEDSSARGLHHTIPMCYVLSFLGGAQDCGMDVPALLARHGISPAMIDSPLSRVSVAQFAALLKHLRWRMRDELLGFGSRPVKLGTFVLATRQMMRCATLGDALRVGFGIYRLAIDEFSAHLRIEGAMARVVIGESAAGRRPGFIQSAFLYWVLGLASWLVQQRIALREAALSRDLPSDSYRESGHLFNVPMRFGAPTSSIAFDASWLAEPVVADPPHLQALARELPGALLVRFRDHSSLTERVRLRLQHQLAAGLPSLEQTAWHLKMTPHSLRRRLAEHGTSFQGIKNALRRDAAIELLTRSSLPLGDISQQLAFSEPSTFHRSFKLWTGVAPGEYRRMHGTVQAGPEGT